MSTTYVPGSGGSLIDLGGGMVAPAIPGQSTLVDLGTTPAGVSLDANGYPIWTATGLPWTGADQQQLLVSKLNTEPTSSTSTYRFGAPSGPASDVPTPSSGLSTYGATTPTSSPVGVAATATDVTSPTNTTSGAITSGPTSVSSSGDALISRLIDLVAAQYSGAGVQGGGSGFGGLVTAPLAGSDFVGGGAASSAPTSHKGLIVLAVIVAAIGVWYYKSHKKRAA